MEFFHRELAKQVQLVHIVVPPLDAVRGLPKLCLFPVAAIPQVGWRPRLIFDFTWICLNEATARKYPEEVMRFGGTLRPIIRRLLVANPRLGQVYLGNVDLADAYMRLWVHLEDTPPVAFLIPRKNPTDYQLVGFHLSLPMGYMDSAPFFRMSAETISYMANAYMDDHHRTPPHPLKVLADAPALVERVPEQDDNNQWKRTHPEQQVNSLALVDVYLENFISTCQGGPTER